MKKKSIILILLCAVAVFTLSACASGDKFITGGKNVHLDGSLYFTEITTGGTVESPTPSGKAIIGTAKYTSKLTSIPEGASVPDAATYSKKESSSFWNSSAKTTEVFFDLTASSKESATEMLEKIIRFSTPAPSDQSDQSDQSEDKSD